MSKINVTAGSLTRILSNVNPHTSRDMVKPGKPMLPAIAAVRLETDGGELLAIATDRYTMAVDRATILDATAPAAGTFVCLLAYGEAERLVKLVKINYGARDAGRELTLELDGGHELLVSSYGDRVGSFTLELADYPRWQGLFPPADAPTLVVGPIGVSMANLVKLAKVTTVTDGQQDKRQATAIIRQQSDVRDAGDGTFSRQAKPIIVTMGDTFRALIMPVRLTEAQTGELAGQLQAARNLIGK